MDFENEFINKIIIQEDKIDIDKDDFDYINYKQIYLDDAYSQKEKYKEIYNNLENIKKKSETHEFKNCYTFVDDNIVHSLKTQLKNIIISQRQKLSNFLHYQTQVSLILDFEKDTQFVKKQTPSSKSLNSMSKRNKFKKLFSKIK